MSSGQHPQQRQPVVLPGLAVGGDAAGVVVAHHDDEAGADDGEQGEQPGRPRPARVEVVLADRPECAVDVADVRRVEDGRPVGPAGRRAACRRPVARRSAMAYLGAQRRPVLRSIGALVPARPRAGRVPWCRAGVGARRWRAGVGAPGGGRGPGDGGRRRGAAAAGSRPTRRDWGGTRRRSAGRAGAGGGPRQSSAAVRPKSRRKPVGSSSSSTSSTVTTPRIWWCVLVEHRGHDEVEVRHLPDDLPEVPVDVDVERGRLAHAAERRRRVGLDEPHHRGGADHLVVGAVGEHHVERLGREPCWCARRRGPRPPGCRRGRQRKSGLMRPPAVSGW